MSLLKPIPEGVRGGINNFTNMKKLFYVTLTALIGCIAVIFVQHSQIKKLTSIHADVEDAVSEEAIEETPSLPVSQLTPYVISYTNSVIRGGKYCAKIVLAVEDSTWHPEFYVEGKRIGDDGIYETPVSAVGLKKYSGNVVYLNPFTGETENKPFREQYIVSEPAVTMTNVDLNVMYRRYDNKFSISVPGVSNDKVQVKVAGATVKQKNNLWFINPNTDVRSVTVSVSAEINGKMQSIGSQEYRVKNLPVPSAYLSVNDREYASGSNIPPSVLTNPAASLVVSYGPDALLNLPFKVTSFTANIKGTTYSSEGNKFTEAQLKAISKMKVGETVVISDIKATTPTGAVLRLAPAIYIVN